MHDAIMAVQSMCKSFAYANPSPDVRDINWFIGRVGRVARYDRTQRTLLLCCIKMLIMGIFLGYLILQRKYEMSTLLYLIDLIHQKRLWH